jgi:hypothetical protein
MRETFQPRKSYRFGGLQPGQRIRIKIPDDDPLAGRRALCAAYAYGRRNGMKFFGKVSITPKRGKVMVIGRAK